MQQDHGAVVVGIDRTGDTPYWIVQNSWGTEWGQDGFIHLAVEEGFGVSGMNMYAEWVDVAAGYPVVPVIESRKIGKSAESDVNV